MSDALRDFLRAALALPIGEQREALLPGYRAAYAAFGSDWDVNTAAFADDYTFRNAGTRKLVGFQESVSGAAEYVREHKRLLDHLNIERIELEDLIPLGGGRVVALLRFVIGAGGGTIDQFGLDLSEFRDGELFRQTMWLDREEGLRELGLVDATRG